MPEESPIPESPADSLSDIVRRAMIEAAELQEIEERITEVSDRISKLTPTPEPPPLEPGEPQP